MAAFVDRVTVHVAAGNGGHGVASVHREKFKPLGGPDGGNGGDGGDVVLVVDPNVHTLLDFHHRPHQKAGNGKPGAGSNRHGPRGEDAVLRVPPGTVVSTADGRQIADLVGAGTRFVAAAGGRGGLGNAALANTRRKAPGFALLGEPGEALDGSSSSRASPTSAWSASPARASPRWSRRMSAARPKIADYPFTTLVPNLGVVRAGDTVFTMADVPGLIPGARPARAWACEFLRHVERCAVLVHVVDMRHDGARAATRRPTSTCSPTSCASTAATSSTWSGRLRFAVLNKIDVPDARELVDLVRPALEKRGLQVFAISAATGEGLAEFGYALAAAVESFRASLPPPEPARIVCARGPWTTAGSPSSGTRTTRTRSSCAASSPSGGSGRPTSPTTRPSATSPTGWTGSASRSELAKAGARGGRRGHDRRGHLRLGADAGGSTRRSPPGLGGAAPTPAWTPRPVQRRRAAGRQDRHAGSPGRARARRSCEPADDLPDDGGRGGEPRRRSARRAAAAGRQGRLVVADHAPPAASTRTGWTRWSTSSAAVAPPARRSCWSPPARSRPGWRRWAARRPAA